MKRNTERDKEICQLYLSRAKKVPALAKQFNVTRPRIYEILKDNGISGRNEIRKQQSLLSSQIVEIINREPQVSIKQIAVKLKQKTSYVKYLIKKYKIDGIKGNQYLFISGVMRERLRNGRIPLTYELLYQKYVIEKNTQLQIAEQLEYKQQTISTYMHRFGIVAIKTKNRQSKV